MIKYHLAYSRKPYPCDSPRDAYVTVACRTDFAFAQSEVKYSTVVGVRLRDNERPGYRKRMHMGLKVEWERHDSIGDRPKREYVSVGFWFVMKTVNGLRYEKSQSRTSESVILGCRLPRGKAWSRLAYIILYTTVPVRSNIRQF
jgi:hypothetical protein